MMVMFCLAAVFCCLHQFGHKLHPMFAKPMVKNMMMCFGLVCAFGTFMEFMK